MATQSVFSALANPTRRALLDLLREGPHRASELAERFDMQRPSVAEHLRALRESGLVEVEARGRERIYHLAPQPLQDVSDWLQPYERFWRSSLRDLRAHLDAEDAP